MKTSTLMGRATLATLFSSFIFMSCQKNNEDVVTTNFEISGVATGLQQNPAVPSSGTATLRGSYNRTTNQLDYTITWSDLSTSVSAAHFHGPAPAGVNAPPHKDIVIQTNGRNGTASGSITLTDVNEGYLLDGMFYYNLQTSTYPVGEVRAQMSASTAN